MLKIQTPAPSTGEAYALKQRTNAETGLQFLIRARECFKDSDNKNTVKSVRHAISSARGAVRICEDRVSRAYEHAVVTDVIDEAATAPGYSGSFPAIRRF